MILMNMILLRTMVMTMPMLLLLLLLLLLLVVFALAMTMAMILLVLTTWMNTTITDNHDKRVFVVIILVGACGGELSWFDGHTCDNSMLRMVIIIVNMMIITNHSLFNWSSTCFSHDAMIITMNNINKSKQICVSLVSHMYFSHVAFHYPLEWSFFVVLFLFCVGIAEHDGRYEARLTFL